MKVTIIDTGEFRPGRLFPENPSNVRANDGTNFYYADALPRKIHYGLVTPGADAWDAVGDIGVEYDATGTNRVVQIDAQPSSPQQRLAYVVWFTEGPGEANGYWSEARFVNLQKPEGKWVCVPVMNSAKLKDGFLIKALYEVAVFDRVNSTPIVFGGRIKNVYYGFTTLDRGQYEVDPNLPWRNSFGELTAEGCVLANHSFVGGEFGASVMPLVWVRVPAGWNLVYRLGIDKFDHDSSWHDVFLGYGDTQVYFRPFSYPG